MRSHMDKILLASGVFACVAALIQMDHQVKIWLLMFVAGVFLLLAGVITLMKNSGLFRRDVFDASPYSATDAAASDKIRMDDVTVPSEHGEKQ